jgi:hypothetical protein
VVPRDGFEPPTQRFSVSCIAYFDIEIFLAFASTFHPKVGNRVGKLKSKRKRVRDK